MSPTGTTLLSGLMSCLGSAGELPTNAAGLVLRPAYMRAGKSDLTQCGSHQNVKL